MGFLLLPVDEMYVRKYDGFMDERAAEQHNILKIG